MSWTKAKIIDKAYGELRLSGYVFDLRPEELENALDRLEAMMASLQQTGVHVSYSFGDDMEAESGLPMHTVETIYCLLAQRLASGLGKDVRAETARVAGEGVQRLRREAVQPRRQQLPAILAGSGNRQRYFTPSPISPIEKDGELSFLESK